MCRFSTFSDLVQIAKDPGIKTGSDPEARFSDQVVQQWFHGADKPGLFGIGKNAVQACNGYTKALSQ